MEEAKTIATTETTENISPTPISVNPVVNTPPQDEGVENTKPASPDEELYKFFGREAEEYIDENVIEKNKEVNNEIDEEINETNNVNTSNDTSTEQKTELPFPEVGEVINKETSPTPSSSPLYTEEDLNEIVSKRVAEEVQKFSNINTFFEEYQKDPYAYMAKYSPQLFNKFDEIQYVKDKLHDEFGEFTIDPQRAYEIGTTDYQYRIRQDALLQEAQRLKNEATQNIQNQETEVNQLETEFKTSKAKALGLDVPTFETRIWNKLKSMDNQTVLDTLVDALIYKEKLEESNKNLKAQLDLTKSAPSPTNLSGTGSPAEDKTMQLIKRMFKDEFD